MNQDLRDRFLHFETITDREELLAAVRELMESYSELMARLETMSQAQTSMATQYQKMKEKLAAAEKENSVLKKENLKLSDQLGLRKRDLFGRGTEKTSEILEKALAGEESEDPLGDEELPKQNADAEAAGTARTLADNAAANRDAGSSGKKKSKKTSGKRKSDLSRLPKHTEFLLDIDRLNESYGEGNWAIRGWTEYRTIESVRATKYTKSVFVPVISAGTEYVLSRMPYDGKLLPRSLASSSLVAEIMYKKFVLGMPFYRIEQDFLRDDVSISRVNMAMWCIRFAMDLFYLVYDHLCRLLIESGYSQSDETTLEVIKDGRKAGAVSYMWVHTASELREGNPIVVFCYELTRNTEHLRDFYLKKGFHGFLTCDAYSAYGLLEKEADGAITVCGCMMHSRRRFVMAILVLNLKGKPAKYVEALPEYRAQTLLDDIYRADEPLKHVTPEERLERRNTEVRPKVDAFFAYLHELKNDWKVSYTERFQDAVDYSLNNEKRLRMFLEDASIPIDNGFCERSIRPMACGRRSWLFCYSVDGAEAMAILYTLAETAKACGAHPYYYYKYLLDVLPKMKVGSDPEIQSKLMPWSQDYKDYEKQQKEEAVRFVTDQTSVQPPKSPKQNRRPLIEKAS